MGDSILRPVPPVDPTRSWPEDFALEDGQYTNICWRCEFQFTGHKRRMVCRLCVGKVIDPPDVTWTTLPTKKPTTER